MGYMPSVYPTSYFSAPSSTLDPTLFEGKRIRSWVRQGIQSLLYGFLGQGYRQADVWAHPWLAGSGVSYQWEAARFPGDLDCLVGVDYVQFRKANPEFTGLSDSEISAQLNEDFRAFLQPSTTNWNGYELTFFVNPGATDIRAIKPYAAYDLKYDEWTVPANPDAKAPSNPEWEAAVTSDRMQATQIVTRFTQALADVSTTHGGPSLRNAQARLEAASAQGAALYDQIHLGRREAFSGSGTGYADFHNYRWQAGKRSGAVEDLRKVYEHHKASKQATEARTYGVELPSADVLIRRAALHYSQR